MCGSRGQRRAQRSAERQYAKVSRAQKADEGMLEDVQRGRKIRIMKTDEERLEEARQEEGTRQGLQKKRLSGAQIQKVLTSTKVEYK